MPGAILIAFEPGYHALPGVMAQDVTTWGEMKQVFRELKKQEVKDAYKAVIIDTIDIAAEKCQKYICQQYSIDNLGDLGYGKGWSAYKQEFNEVFRGIAQLGYAVFFLGHDKEVTVGEGDNERIVIRPALSASTKTVIAGMADIYGYAHQVKANSMSVLTLRCTDGSIECGGRFKRIPNEIEMSYDNLKDAVQEAIKLEAEEHDGKFITNERQTVTEAPTFNFNALMEEFNTIVGELMNKDSAYYAPQVTNIIEKYLGKGKKIAEATPDQAEFISLIIGEIKEDLMTE
jgi:predicted  nucleic acid-binding Zn-ribbon protein